MNDIPEKASYIFEKFVKVINGFKNANHLTILDIGCANGVFIDVLGKYDNTCYGVDFNDDAVNTYRQKHPNSHIELYDINKVGDDFPFKQTKFDVITCFDVIEHLLNFNNLKSILQNNLKSDGLFVMTTPNANALEKKINSNYSGEYDKSHTMLFTPYTLDFFLRRVGLTKVLLYTPYTFMFFPNIFNRVVMNGGQIFGIYGKGE